MTELAYVRAVGLERVPDELETRVRARTQPKVRIVVRRDGGDLTLEPFVASASIAALLGIRRKRADACAVLAAIVSELCAHAREVRVIRRAEGEAEAAIADAHEGELEAAIARAPCSVRVVAAR